MQVAWSNLSYKILTWKRLWFSVIDSIMNWETLSKILNWKLDDLAKTIHQNYNTLRLNQKLCENLFGTLLKMKFFSTMKTSWQVHMPKRVKLIDSKGELMNNVSFRGRSFSTMYKVHSFQGWIFQMRRHSTMKFRYPLFFIFVLLFIHF